MTTMLFALTGLAAGFECLAVFKGWRRLEYFAKPAAMLFLFGWLLRGSPGSSTGLSGGTAGPLIWFSAGILFSLIGMSCCSCRMKNAGSHLG